MKKVRPGHSNIYGKWPRGVRLYAYDENMDMFDNSTDRQYDLHDNLFQAWPGSRRRVFLGVAVNSKNWVRWDEENLRCIEELITDDFEFECEKVKIRRQTQPKRPCAEEFVWRLDIRG